MDNDRKWHMAWARLDAFEKHLPSMVFEKDVAEFHEILGLLRDSSGEDVQLFRINDAEVRPQVIAAIAGYPSATVCGAPCCDKDLMLRKIASVKNYFSRIMPPREKAKVGF
jgi:hypothetical protein